MAGSVFTGIDIGSQSIKVVSLKRVGTQYRILGAGMAHIPVISPDEAESYDEAISRILKNIIKTHKIPVGHTVSGLSGKNSLIRYMNVPIVPPWKLAMLMSYEIDEHRASSGEIAFDFTILNLPDFEEGQFSVMLAQAQESAINSLLSTSSKGAGRSDEIDINALGVHNLYAVSTDFNEEEICLCLDIGATETSVSLQQGEALFFARSISHGGEKFTANISKTLEISQEAAEELKKLKGSILHASESESVSDEKLLKLSNACKAEAAALVSAVQSSIVFFRNQLLRAGSGRTVRLSKEKEKIFKPEKIYITGGGANLKGLDEYLAARMGVPCKVLDLSVLKENLSGSSELAINDENISSFASTFGLALGRARVQGSTLNLITPSEKAKRKFWNETFFAAAAGVIGLIIIILAVVFSYMELNNEKDIAEKWTKSIKQAKARKDEFIKLKQENRKLFAMTSSLEQRVYSSFDMLNFLSYIKSATSSDFFFTGITTNFSFDTFKDEPSKNKKAPVRSRRGMPASKETSSSNPKNENIYSNKKIILEGYCFNKDKAEASKRITEFAEKLEKHKSGFFVAVTQEYGRWIEDEEELKVFFDLPQQDSSRMVKPGAAFQFRLECWIRDI